jgi:hypothetical protein
MGGSGLPRYSDYANVSLPMFNQLYAPSGRVGAGGPVPIAPPSTQANPFAQGFANPDVLQFLSPGFVKPPTQYAPAPLGGGGGAVPVLPAPPPGSAPLVGPLGPQPGLEYDPQLGYFDPNEDSAGYG